MEICAMTTAATEKRLDKIEIQLTPKEWAIRLANEHRQYPSIEEWCRAVAKETPQECLMNKGFLALKMQAEQRYPGKRPEDIRLRNLLCDSLSEEYHKLKMLQRAASLAVAFRIDELSLRAALKFTQLHNLILQDATGRIALSKRASVDVVSLVEDWITDSIPIIIEIFALQAGIECVQDRHFDGRPILFRDWEARLEATVEVVEEGVGVFNVYMKTVQELITDNGESGQILPIDLLSVKTGAKAEGGPAHAELWFEQAMEEATEDFEEREIGGWQALHNRIRKHWGV